MGVAEAPITISRSRSNAFIQSEGVRLASATELPDERRRVERSSFIAAICCAWNSRSHSEGVRSIDLLDERRRIGSSSFIAATCCAWNSLSHSEGVRSVVKSPPLLESDAGQMLVWSTPQPPTGMRSTFDTSTQQKTQACHRASAQGDKICKPPFDATAHGQVPVGFTGSAATGARRPQLIIGILNFSDVVDTSGRRFSIPVTVARHCERQRLRLDSSKILP